MKQTVNVNIGSMPFTLDEDAYRTLRDYFDDIRSRLPDDDTETEADLETRMGEILREKVASPMYVVSIDIVRAAIDRLGTPDCFGARHGEPVTDEHDAQPPYRKLYRSRENRSIAGVCGGLAEYIDADPSVLRLVTLLLILFGGISIWIYVILWIVVPEAPARKFNVQDKKTKNA
ncbi:MAG: PspC domain-containing protein [Alistipes senegalensis]|nr:PspC domain-containing protein [Bacteroides cellulosilyticus]MCM1351816.1 PspC domain-containing protein [Alistipes senegalensis]